ncbi:MAG: phosphatidylserine decarboxylase [Bacilli bacterium]
MMYYDLKSKKYIEKKDSLFLKLLYNNFVGRVLLKVVISKPIRKLYSNYMCSNISRRKINKFIKKNNINMQEYEEQNYNCFNEFFIRKIKPEARKIDKGLIAIADSKLIAYKIDNNSSFMIKNSLYTVKELIKEDSSLYNGGYALVFRLCVDDYHHYVFPDDGKIISMKDIDGVLHTVQPLAFKKYKVFHENARTVTFLDCENFGKVCYIEVGAMMIGKIVNEKVTTFKKGEEKGHFEFGGSTCVLLFEKDKIKLNPEIIKNSEEGIETIVKLGQKLD